MKTWLQSRRFFIQILTFTVGLLFILCILFVSILYINSKKSTTKTIYKTESEHNAELLRQSDIYFGQLITVGTSFINLTIPYDSLNTSKSMWTRNLFDAMLQSHINTNRYISGIDVEISGISLYPSTIPHEVELGNFYTFEMYSSAEASWPYYFDLTSKNDIPNNQVTLTLNGYLLSKQIFTYKSKDRLEYLLTPDGTVLLTNQKQSFFQNIEDLLPGIDLSESTASKQSLGTYENYYYVLSEPDKYHFRTLSLVPRSFYSSQYTTVALQTLLMSCCLFSVAIVISFFLTSRFYRPIKKTIELLQTYVPDVLHEYENEVVYIHQNIAKYTAQEKNDAAAMSKTLSRIQNAQVAVLQYQINSHFLFNTLENIKSLSISKLGMNNEIESSIILLNTIIHEGVYQKKLFVSLAHELHLAKCYLALMHLRFPDVNVQWSEDEKLSQCQVFKFSLQPVLENCFSHAFKARLPRQKLIQVSIRQNSNRFSIFVRDNGLGMDEASVQNLKKLLNAPEESNSANHVGIQNIHKRITDTFGQDYGIRIKRASPGTIVEIRYPLISSDEI